MVIDASIWVSSLVEQDVHYRISHNWLSRRMSSDESLVIPTLALPEVAGAIARRTGRGELGRQAAEFLLRVPKLRLVTLDDGLGEEAARAAADHHLRGADAVYAATAKMLGLPLITWDLETLARTGSYVTVLQPDQAS